MTKKFRRILCGVLTTVMASSLVLEQSLRMDAENVTTGTTSRSVSFKEANGLYDFSQIQMENFNSTVLKNEGCVYETRTVIVSLSAPSLLESAAGEALDGYLQTRTGKKKAETIKKQQEEFLDALSACGLSYKLKDQYTAIANAVAIEIDTSYVSKIKGMANVESVVLSRTYAEPKTAVTYSSRTNVSDYTNATSVYKTGIYDTSEYTTESSVDYSEGAVVAVLDTGLDYTHSAFQTMPQSLGLDQNGLNEKLRVNNFAAEKKSGKALTSADVYINDKVPFAYDYADDDTDVYPAYSNHGTHVAGIIGGQDDSYTDKDGNLVNEPFIGSAPNAQLIICKVFTDDLDSKDLGGAVSEDILAALEDCVYLGVDVINMSLGTSAGFSTTDDGDDEGVLLNQVYTLIGEAGISLMAAASNDYSSAYGGSFGTNLTSDPDSGTVGSPGTYASALAVASISGKQSEYLVGYPQEKVNDVALDGGTAIFYEKSSDENSVQFEFLKQMQALSDEYDLNGEFEYVVVPERGVSSGYTASIKRLFKEEPRIALIERGYNTFQEKVEEAHKAGAIAAIVYNNVAGTIRMNLGDIDDFEPVAISISKEAGEALVALAGKNGNKRIGKLVIDKTYLAGPFMSEFSSWGPTPDLKLKPEITAHGGEITSTVPGGYGEQSGTSMASPNMAGFGAVARNYLKNNTQYQAELLKIATQIKAEYSEENEGKTLSDAIAYNRAVTRLLNLLIMSTATTAVDRDGLAYSPRKQGAGLANISDTLTSSAYLYNENVSDARAKIEYGDDPDKTGVYELTFGMKNFGSETLSFSTKSVVMTEQITKISSTTNAVKEQAYMLDDNAPVWSVSGNGVTLNDSQILVESGADASITVKITLSDAEKNYLNKNFANGMYVEGFLKLVSVNEAEQCDLSIPFLAFYGDWTDADMLDYTAYELAKLQQAAASKEEAPKEKVYATQAFTSYYNDTFILPMGGYVYLLSDYDTENDPMYTNMEYCAVSRYNEYYGEGSAENYMTSTRIQAVYAGLLRNARVVNYRLYNETTGELIMSDSIDRVGKAYSGGGASVPANVKLEMYPDEQGLVENGKYRLEFDFYSDAEGLSSPEIQDLIASGDLVVEDANTFEFTFYVDYEAPVLENVDIRYETIENNGKETQDVYLDLEIYDNHYPQAVMLCYVDGEGDEQVLNLATEYVTPVRDPVKGGTSKVSIEITDILKNELVSSKGFYVQIDDYALNNCVYALTTDLKSLQTDMLPDSFDVSNCEKNTDTNVRADYQVTIEKYETFRVELAYEGEANKSNFTWSSQNNNVANVQSGTGEIVGLKEGQTLVTVTSGNNYKSKRILVTVEDKGKNLPTPSISFGVIKTSTLSLQKASGVVEVNPGEEFTLDILVEPWWYPEDLEIYWTSKKPEVATVDQSGTVKILREGVATIEAYVMRNGEPIKTMSTSVRLDVQEEFSVSSFTLNDYHGIGYNGEICLGCGSAFTYEELIDSNDTDTIKNNCPNCGSEIIENDEKGVTVLKIPTDMNIMYIGTGAFDEIDNVEILVIPKSVVQIQERAFVDCTSIKEIYFVDTVAKPVADADLSMIYQSAFYGCTTLEKLDLTNTKTFMVGTDAFNGCTNLSTIVKMDHIGATYDRAFANTALTEIDLSGVHMSGKNVFSGCENLTKVTLGSYTSVGDSMFDGYTLQYYDTDLEEVVTQTLPACENLVEVSFVKNGAYAKNVDIGAYAFRNCKNLTTLTGIDNENVTVRVIGTQAFANTALTTFAVPNGLRTLGGEILKGTSVSVVKLHDNFDISNLALTGLPFGAITLDTSATTIYVFENGALYNADKTKLLLVTDGAQFANATLPATVTEIGAYALANVQGVTTFTLPVHVESIGNGAFENSSIERFLFADGACVSTIPNSAFRGSKLSQIVLPESVTSVGDFAFANTPIENFMFNYENAEITFGNGVFANCSSLTGVTFTAVNQVEEATFVFGNETFKNCSALSSVALPKIVDLGSNTFVGCFKLERVDFSKATTIGENTFSGKLSYNAKAGVYEYEGLSLLNEVKLGAISKIGNNAFAGCSALTSIDLTGVTSIGAYAFAWCDSLASLTNSGDVLSVDEYAFYNCNELEIDIAQALPALKEIGEAAFAVDNGNGSKVKVSLGTSLETIGTYAFFGAETETVRIPASVCVKTNENGQTVNGINYGAFANMSKLSTITVAEENLDYFAEDGVLYRKIRTSNGAYTGEYELVAYPSAKTVETTGENSKKVYEIKEKTVYVLAYAFYNLNEKALDEVVFPYSVKAIGDSAFYMSGVKEYTFECIKAPVLEVIFDANLASMIVTSTETETFIGMKATPNGYRGYYNNNFEDLFYYHTEYRSAKDPKPAELTMNVPTNGVGYDNDLYSRYFATVKEIGVLMNDTAREAKTLIESLKSTTEINAWLESSVAVNEQTKAEVQEFSDLVKRARYLYNQIKNDETQLAYLGAENAQKLADTEEAMREVKNKFGVLIKPIQLSCATDGYKKEYKVGETFVSDGLVVYVEYDDGSMGQVALSDLTLQTGAFTENSRYALFEYEWGTGENETLQIRVPVTIQKNEPVPEQGGAEQIPGGTQDPSEDKENGSLGLIVGIVIAVVVLAGGGVAVFLFLKKKKLAVEKNAETSSEDSNGKDCEQVNEVLEEQTDNQTFETEERIKDEKTEDEE